MKRLISIALILAISLPLISCGSTAARYKDGIYEAKGERWNSGYEKATVKINGGKIEGITLRKFDAFGKEINYEEWTGNEIVEGRHKPNLKRLRVDLANSMIRQQTSDVDTLTGASASSINWKLAVKRALDKAATRK